MYTISGIFFRVLRRIYKTTHRYDWHDNSRVQISGQAANDYVKSAIEKSTNGLLVAKFGTTELNAICCSKRVRDGLTKNDYLDYIRGKGCIYPEDSVKALAFYSGFFPTSVEKQNEFTDLVMEDIKDIDILASYVDQESYLENELQHCDKIDLYGYCAPFGWSNPWTSILEGKKVLVVHPFTDSIKAQYQKRELLFTDKSVLPEFKELILVKAVQSIARNGKSTGYIDWFEALQAMELEIDKHDYDIALIGCGAYGMCLAAHCKRKGKIAIHMAGWVQMLFGIYGQRWAVDQPEYAHLINDNWIRPLESEKPANVEKIENGAYW